MNRIASSLPGRIRIRDKCLRNPARMSLLEPALRQLDGVLSLQSNPGAGSIVILFDPSRVADLSVLEQSVDLAVDAALAAPLPRQNLKACANRYSKYGMLGSLAGSMVLAAVGQKRWHVLTGGAFLACLGVHLITHRKSLLR